MKLVLNKFMTFTFQFRFLALNTSIVASMLYRSFSCFLSIYIIAATVLSKL